VALLSAWKDSLSVFYPKNVGRFLLVTGNTVKQAYGVFFKYWWWIVLVISAIIWMKPPIEVLTRRQEFIILLLLCLCAIAWVSFILSVRPSLERKSLSYFLRHTSYLPSYFLGVTAYMVLLVGGVYLLGSLFEVESGTWWAVALAPILQCWWFYVIGVELLFFTSFFFDSAGSFGAALGSLYRSFTMGIYNIPFVIVITLLMMTITLGLSLLWMACVELFGLETKPFLLIFSLMIGLFVGGTAWICFIANFYTQKIYQQYDLYFKSIN
jgi:hypothetical protein